MQGTKGYLWHICYEKNPQSVSDVSFLFPRVFSKSKLITAVSVRNCGLAILCLEQLYKFLFENPFDY